MNVSGLKEEGGDTVGAGQRMIAMEWCVQDAILQGRGDGLRARLTM